MSKRYSDITALFGKRLKTIRVQKGYTIESFCKQFRKETGHTLGTSTVSRWENGLQDPLVSTVASIAKFLDVNPLWLIGETDERDLLKTTIQDSAIATGQNSAALVVKNGEATPPLQEIDREVLAICQRLPIKRKIRLLTFAYELDEEGGGNHADDD